MSNEEQIIDEFAKRLTDKIELKYCRGNLSSQHVGIQTCDWIREIAAQMKQELDIPNNHGWKNINEEQPKENEEVLVIFEREASEGCTYHFQTGYDTYHKYMENGHFPKESEVWHVKYWRKKDTLPFPDAIVLKELESCKQRNVMPNMILNYQKTCGVDLPPGQDEWER